MDVFSSPAFDDHEQVLFFYDRPSGLQGHRRAARHHARASRRRLPDLALRQRGRGPDRRAAAVEGHDLQGGDGRSAVRRRQDRDHRRSPTDASEALFRALGRAIDSLGGRYYTGEDVGTSPPDMDWAGQETPYVLGRSQGRQRRSVADHRARRLARHQGGGQAPLRPRRAAGVRVAIQGTGHVGDNLGPLLAQEGAQLILADIDPSGRRAGHAARCPPVGCDEILAVDAEVLAPCALGGVINDRTLAAAVLRHRGRCGEQPAARAPPRRRAACARHPLCARLRDQRRRPDQHRPGAAAGRLRSRARARACRDHRDDARRDLRALGAGGPADPRDRGSGRRGADRRRAGRRMSRIAALASSPSRRRPADRARRSGRPGRRRPQGRWRPDGIDGRMSHDGALRVAIAARRQRLAADWPR